MTRHLLDVDDLSGPELNEVLALGTATDPRPVLAGRGAALVFEKPSNRTRNSTEMAVVALGGHPIYLRREEVDIDGRESAEDVARTLALYHSVIAARVYDHRVLQRQEQIRQRTQGNPLQRAVLFHPADLRSGVPRRSAMA